jgi:tRNA uridine 5-carboxymethylaminomethyl modification enzyme
MDFADLRNWIGEPILAAAKSADSDLSEELAEDAVYAPYLARQDSELRELRASEALRLGDDFPYGAIPGLSREMIERLARARPETLAAAGRVPGVTPAALSALLVHARRLAA